MLDEDAANRPGMVLVVDDNPSVCIVTERMLASLGYDSRTVGSTNEALALIDALGGRVTTVLLDARISGVGSEEALRRITGRANAPLVFVTSGLQSDEEMQSLVAAGAVGFLQKPYSLADLASALSPLRASDASQ